MIFDQMYSFPIYFFYIFCMPHPSKCMQNEVIIPSLLILTAFQLQKGPCFWYYQTNLISNWLFDTLNTLFLYVDLNNLHTFSKKNIWSYEKISKIFANFVLYIYLFCNNFERCNFPNLKILYGKLICFISYFICCNFFNLLCMSYLPKLGLKYFSIFLAIFALFRLQKDLIFGMFILDLAPKQLLGVFNKHVIYFE